MTKPTHGAAHLLAAHQLTRVVLEADEKIRRGARVVWIDLDPSPRAWGPEDVRLARALVRRVGYDAYASPVVSAAREEVAALVEGGCREGVVAALARRRALIAAWRYPVTRALVACEVRLAGGDHPFILHTRIAHPGGLDRVRDHWVAVVTDRVGVYIEFDDLEEHPLYPVPIAFVDLERLLPAVGHVLRAEERAWLDVLPDEIYGTLDATDLFRVLAYASGVVDERVWDMDIPDLAAIDTGGGVGYVDLIDALRRLN